MDLQQLNELDFENIGSWPAPIKAIAILILCALIAGGSYYYWIDDSIAKLKVVQKKEVQLKQQYKTKAQMAANLKAYQDQMVELEKLLESQLKQLPNKHEVPGLIDDISFIGTNNGLKLLRINWEAEKKMEFSTELPMRIDVQGSYHQLGEFAADIAALPRIVILDSFSIGRAEGDLLTLNVLAKTYKYDEKQEVAK
ncbi:type IV pilus inner membrane component PilO [Dongshaea marina]|uniref:type 4a pilus biogenesis protein PilO n=1 Tax=Dongshaea marina TaxID=2047966 RepID=UPI000D3EB926|nr:type 4a pilus biogenesis protein PilO [Dongshaea marina]